MIDAVVLAGLAAGREPAEACHDLLHRGFPDGLEVLFFLFLRLRSCIY
jgi:hypothetical protein